MDKGQSLLARSDKRNAANLEAAIETLSRAGVRLVFPEHIDAFQTTWPAESSISEQDLRSELQGIRTDLETLRQRTEDLLGRLPDPPEYQLNDVDEAPASVYFILRDAVIYLDDEVLGPAAREVDGALAATPQSIRAEWLARQVPFDRFQDLVHDRDTPKNGDDGSH